MPKREQARVYNNHWRRTVHHLPCVLYYAFGKPRRTLSPDSIAAAVEEVSGIRLKPQTLEKLIDEQPIIGCWQPLRVVFSRPRHERYRHFALCKSFYGQYKCARHRLVSDETGVS